MKWGIYDSRDQCWLGDDNGPKLFDDADPALKGNAEPIAKVAAQGAAMQLRRDPREIRAKEYDGTGTKLKDQVEPKMSMEEALRRMERGRL